MENRFAEAKEALSHLNFFISPQDVIHLLDLTLLDESATEQDIQLLAQNAQAYNVAALCVFPQHLSYVPVFSTVPKATVVNFPTGNDFYQAEQEIKVAIFEQKVHEIDYVFPYSLYLHTDKQQALQHCARGFQLCTEQGVVFKVIIETGAFPSIKDIYRVSIDILQQGCHFLKTSTGKIPQGASLEAAFAMLSAIYDTQSLAGIKISGGIKTTQQAFEYIKLAEMILQKKVNKSWFRIGASSLLHELLSFSTATQTSLPK